MSKSTTQPAQSATSTAGVIVNFSHVAKHRAHEAVADTGAGDLAGDARWAAFVASLPEAMEVMEAEERHPDVLTTPENRTASLLQQFLAEAAADSGKLVDVGLGAREVKFDNHDVLGWAGSVSTWLAKLDKRPFLAPPAQTEPLPARCRVGVLGDWGSGLYGAPVIARTIASDVEPYDLLLHLGDVYYAGTERAVQDRFLDLWPFRENRPISRALNSNHEMYTGGSGYFGLTLPRFGQSSSCVALSNERWLLIGLDSAYREHNLSQEQADWVKGLCASPEHAHKKVVLFSHHQPYSHFEKGGAKLVSALDPLLTSGRIFAWYWGHEHRAVLYDLHPGWKMYGRCIGHSGFPAFRDKVAAAPVEVKKAGNLLRRLKEQGGAPGALILDGDNPYVVGHEADYQPNGYLTLVLDGEHLIEELRAPEGQILVSNQLC